MPRDRAWLLLVGLLVLSACTGGGSGAPRPEPVPEPTEATTGAEGAGPDPAPAAERGEVGPRWEPLSEPGVGSAVTDLAFDPSDPARVLAAGAAFGVGASLDGGRSWQPAVGLPASGASSVAFHPDRPEEAWAGTGAGPHVSYDGGRTWERRGEGMRSPLADAADPAIPIGPVLVDPSDGDRLLAFEGGPMAADPPAGDPGGRIWESVDAGRSWALRADLGPHEAVAAATLMADGDTVLAVTRRGGLFRSTDGGRSWDRAPSSPGDGPVTAVVAHPTRPNRAWATVAADGSHPGPSGGTRTGTGSAVSTVGVYRSDDGGITWRPARTQPAIQPDTGGSGGSYFAALAVAPADPDILYTADAAVDGRSVHRSDDGGRTWQLLPGSPTGFYAGPPAPTTLAIAPDDPARVLAGNGQSILASDDGGQTWNDLGAAPHAEGFRGAGLSGLRATAIDFAPDGSLAVQGHGPAPLLVGRPDGSWRAALQDWDTGGGGYDVSIAGEAWWALLGERGRFNGLARSSDNGLTWDVHVGDELPDRSHAVDPPPRSVLALSETSALVVLGGELWRTADEGMSWTRVTEAVQGPLVRWDGDLPVVYGAGPEGVLRSRNGGRSFQPLDGGGPRGATGLAVDGNGRVHAAAPDGPDAGLWRHDRGWRRLTVDPAPVAVAVDPADPAHVLVALPSAGPGAGGGADPVRAGVLRSTDAGRSWAPTDAGLGVSDVTTLAFDPHGSGRLIAGTAGGGFYQLTGT